MANDAETDKKHPDKKHWRILLTVLQNKNKVLLRVCKLIIPFNSFTVLPSFFNWLLWSNRICNAHRCFRAPEIKLKRIHYSHHTWLPLLNNYFVMLHTEFDTRVIHLCLPFGITLHDISKKKIIWDFNITFIFLVTPLNICLFSFQFLPFVPIILASTNHQLHPPFFLPSFLLYPSNLWLIHLHFLLPWPNITFASQTINNEFLRK